MFDNIELGLTEKLQIEGGWRSNTARGAAG